MSVCLCTRVRLRACLCACVFVRVSVRGQGVSMVSSSDANTTLLNCTVGGRDEAFPGEDGLVVQDSSNVVVQDSLFEFIGERRSIRNPPPPTLSRVACGVRV